ncbi:hypothetical protein L596_006135 [Steinernema carpocapsae]|uniref:Uncharacterized protein n=1 Tax=Steinernema carpocapsae TaxID=34508 RepID=A0A4V6I8P6_STECR|nr:hypothetical protein L596_006135 [Steinernema carpocapsae]
MLRYVLVCICAANFGVFCVLTTVNEVDYVKAMNSHEGVCSWASYVFLIFQGVLSAMSLILLVGTIALLILLRRSVHSQARYRIFTILAYMLGASFLVSIFCLVAYFISVYTILDDCFLHSRSVALRNRTFAFGIAGVFVNVLLFLVSLSVANSFSQTSNETQGAVYLTHPKVFVVSADTKTLSRPPSYGQFRPDAELPAYGYHVPRV